MSRRRPGQPSRLGSTLFAVGCLSVLGVTFLGGVAAGRRWPGWFPSLGSPVAARAAGDVTARKAGDGRPGDRSRSPEPTPGLTFYQELTAPLTAPPPPPPRPKPEKPMPASRGPLQADASGEAPARASTPSDGPRYAVQVGAFKERGPAEAMRTTLAGAGWDAYLVEVDGADVVRYRVRVGAYSTREEARQAAQRLSSERRLSTYVTTR